MAQPDAGRPGGVGRRAVGARRPDILPNPYQLMNAERQPSVRSDIGVAPAGAVPDAGGKLKESQKVLREAVGKFAWQHSAGSYGKLVEIKPPCQTDDPDQLSELYHAARERFAIITGILRPLTRGVVTGCGKASAAGYVCTADSGGFFPSGNHDPSDAGLIRRSPGSA